METECVRSDNETLKNNLRLVKKKESAEPSEKTPEDLLKRQVAKHSNGSIRIIYFLALRTLSLTLHLYSPHV